MRNRYSRIIRVRPSCETIFDPFAYSESQVAEMCLISAVLNRGKLIVCVPPHGGEEF